MSPLKTLSWIPVVLIWLYAILIIIGAPKTLQQNPQPLQVLLLATYAGGLFLLYQLFKDRIHFQTPFMVYLAGFMLCWAFGIH